MIHEFPNGIKIRKYSNGSFACETVKGWRNIPSEFAEKLIKEFALHDKRVQEAFKEGYRKGCFSVYP